MRRHQLAGVCLTAAMLLAGCGAQPGKTKMTYSRNASAVPPMDVVERDQEGEYALYPANSGNPLFTKSLRRGDEYGFEKNSDGTVVGVMVHNGEHKEIPLTATLATAYYWKYKKD